MPPPPIPSAASAPATKSKRIAGQEGRHHQPRLAKNDGKQDRVDPHAVLRHQQRQMLVEVQDDINELGKEFHGGGVYPTTYNPDPMPRILPLPDLLISQIAAGEVVERPASVLKELIENSLDAGATKIDVQIEEGGVKLIRVADNGGGMPRDDLPLALARHATSKIATLDDLERVASYGFRGEALASIAAVARVSITSRTADAPHAWKLDAGTADSTPAALAEGTVIVVADLYFNTPARRKFLKTTGTEYAHCDDVLMRMAQARPDVSFTLAHNGQVKRRLASADFSRRAQDLLGDDFLTHARQVVAEAGPLRLVRLRRPARLRQIITRGAVFLRQWPLRARQAARPRGARGLCRRAAWRASSGLRAVPRTRSGDGGCQRASGQDGGTFSRCARRASVRLPCPAAHAGRAAGRRTH